MARVRRSLPYLMSNPKRAPPIVPNAASTIQHQLQTRREVNIHTIDISELKHECEPRTIVRTQYRAQYERCQPLAYRATTATYILNSPAHFVIALPHTHTPPPPQHLPESFPKQHHSHRKAKITTNAGISPSTMWGRGPSSCNVEGKSFWLLRAGTQMKCRTP